MGISGETFFDALVAKGAKTREEMLAMTASTFLPAEKHEIIKGVDDTESNELSEEEIVRMKDNALFVFVKFGQAFKENSKQAPSKNVVGINEWGSLLMDSTSRYLHTEKEKTKVVHFWSEALVRSGLQSATDGFRKFLSLKRGAIGESAVERVVEKLYGSSAIEHPKSVDLSELTEEELTNHTKETVSHDTWAGMDFKYTVSDINTKQKKAVGVQVKTSFGTYDQLKIVRGSEGRYGGGRGGNIMKGYDEKLAIFLYVNKHNSGYIDVETGVPTDLLEEELSRKLQSFFTDT